MLIADRVWLPQIDSPARLKALVIVATTEIAVGIGFVREWRQRAAIDTQGAMKGAIPDSGGAVPRTLNRKHWVAQRAVAGHAVGCEYTQCPRPCNTGRGACTVKALAAGIRTLGEVAGGLDLIGLLGFPLVVRTHAGHDAPLRALPTELAALFALRSPGWRTAGAARVRLLLDHLVRHHGRAFVPRPLASFPRVSAAVELAENRLHDPLLSVSALAAVAGVSEQRLRTIFRATMGCSPIAHLQHCRIARACALLAGEPLALAEIARRCGFTDTGYFHRVFRRITGRTPGSWRVAEL